MNDLSLEYLQSSYTVFEKANMIRKLSDINNKIISLDKIVLLKNTMLHIFDNVNHSDSSTDDFDISKYSFLNNRTNIKYIHNFLDFDNIDKELLSSFSHRFYRQKLLENIRSFSLSNRKFMIPTKDLSNFVGNKNCLLIENYNPLYRIITTNDRALYKYYQYRMIFTTILDNITKYDRQHFLVIPVEDNFSVHRSNIISIAQSNKISPQRLMNSSHFYFFIIDLILLFMDNELSTFNRLDDDNLLALNIIFINGDKSIVFNIGTMLSLLTSKAYIFRFLNTIISLSETSSLIEDIDEEEHNDEIVSTTVGEKETNTIDNKEPPVVSKKAESVVLSDVMKLEFKDIREYYFNTKKHDMYRIINLIAKYSLQAYGIIDTNTKQICSSLVLIDNFPISILTDDETYDDSIIKLVTNVYTEPEYQKQGLMNKILSYVIDLNKDDTIYLKVNKTNKVAIDFYKSKDFNELNVKANDPSALIMRYGDVNIPSIKVSKPVIKNALLPKSVFHNKINDNAISNIVLTEAQKTRIEKIANKYKTINVTTDDGVKTIEEIINQDVDPDVTSTKIDVPGLEHIDKSMLAITTIDFDQHYNKNMLHKDILNNIVSFNKNGLFLIDYVEDNEYNDLNHVKKVKAVFSDIRGKQHTINFKLPMPDEEGYYLVNGVKLSMTKQLVNIPICKISPTRVSLISDFIKTLVDKVSSKSHSVVDQFTKNIQKLNITVIPKTNMYIGIDLPYEYKLFGYKYAKISTATHTFIFDYKDRFDYYDYKLSTKISKEDIVNKLISLESSNGSLIGQFNNVPDVFIFMTKFNKLNAVNIISNNKVDIPNNIISCIDGFNTPAEWCDLKILDKNIPIGFILGYRYGLSTVLDKIKLDYRFVEKNTRQRVLRTPTELAIEFQDGWLVFDRYPLLQSYIVAGLVSYKETRNYKMIDFDGKDVYYDLLMSKGMSINYLRGIDSYFSFFIDPITEDTLIKMNEPTNTRDLLIRAVEMLTEDVDKEPSSILNFRVRAAEKIPSMIYNEIARQYANYINSEFKDVSFSINTEAIFQRLIQDETMTLKETINPIHSVKEISRVTHSGFGGRSAEAFVARDRKYASDAIGILSESTTDSGSVGMVSALTCDPNIKNIRGMFSTNEDLQPTNILSDVSLLMPNATHDDQIGPTNQ